MEISFPSILRFLYSGSTDVVRFSITTEFNYRWYMVKSGNFQCSRDVRESTTRSIAQQLYFDCKGADWVLDPRGLMNKANLTLVVMFFWLLVRHHLSLTDVDNIHTWVVWSW